MNLPKYIDRSTDKFFTYKDWREQLQILVKGYSFIDAERMYYNGQIGQKVWEAFCRVWGWSTFRMSNPYDWKQDCFWKKYGKQAFYRKINRTRAAFGFEPLIDPLPEKA